MSKRNPNAKFCPSLRPLPHDFADRVLELEASVETESDLDALKQLLELYSVSGYSASSGVLRSDRRQEVLALQGPHGKYPHSTGQTLGTYS